jgi:hypothetical protein
LLLFLLQNFFPGLIAVVYVLRPSGLLQKAISEVSNKFFREDFKFKVRALIIMSNCRLHLLLPYSRWFLTSWLLLLCNLSSLSGSIHVIVFFICRRRWSFAAAWMSCTSGSMLVSWQLSWAAVCSIIIKNGSIPGWWVLSTID